MCDSWAWLFDVDDGDGYCFWSMKKEKTKFEKSIHGQRVHESSTAYRCAPRIGLGRSPCDSDSDSGWRLWFCYLQRKEWEVSGGSFYRVGLCGLVCMVSLGL